MWKLLTYRKKNQILWIGGAALVLFIYFFTISDTLDLISETNALEERTQQSADMPGTVVILKSQIAEIEKLMGASRDSGKTFQNELLDVVSAYCKESGIVLKEFPAPVVHRDHSYRVETSMFTIEGHFTGLVKLVYLLEQVKRIGRVASVEFVKGKNQAKKPVLWAIIYVQNISKER